MQKLIITILFISSLIGCRKNNHDQEKKNENVDTIKTNISNSEKDNMNTTNQKIEFNDLFNEGSLIKFTPNDVENANTAELNEFKEKLRLFEKSHPTLKEFEIENLNTLVNNETFANSDYFMNSQWLGYFINKYKIYNLYEIMNTAINQEDYNAVNIIIKTGYIISKEELKLASEIKESSIINIKLNKEKNGLDEKGDPTFYNDKQSKAKEIYDILNKIYNYKIYDKDGYTNLREDSFEDAFIIGTIKSGEHIDILDNKDQEWLYINTVDSREGYVFKTKIVSK